MNTMEDVPTTFRGFCAQFQYPTLGALRKMAFECPQNGLAPAFLKVGRRRLVLPATLFRLIKEKGSH